MNVCMYGTVKKTHQFICIRSTGNAYDVVSHRRLSGPRAPQYFGQVYAYGYMYHYRGFIAGLGPRPNGPIY